MKSGRQSYLNSRVLFLQLSTFLSDSKGKGAEYGFQVQEEYLYIFILLMGHKCKEMQKKSLVKNLR